MATKAATTKETTKKSTANPAETKAAAAKPAAPKKADPAPPGLKEGDVAPAFELPGAGGESVSIEALKGKKIVLYFYPKDDTSGCTREAIEFNGLRDKFAKAKTVVVGMSPDSVKSHDKFREKYELAFPLASDETKETLTAYGVWAEKSMYGRKYMGVERTTFLIGVDGRIARIWRKVKVPDHAEEVLEAAKAL